MLSGSASFRSYKFIFVNNLISLINAKAVEGNHLPLASKLVQIRYTEAKMESFVDEVTKIKVPLEKQKSCSTFLLFNSGSVSLPPSISFLLRLSYREIYHSCFRIFLNPSWAFLWRTNNQTKEFLDSVEIWNFLRVQRELNSTGSPHPSMNAKSSESWNCQSG